MPWYIINITYLFAYFVKKASLSLCIDYLKYLSKFVTSTKHNYFFLFLYIIYFFIFIFFFYILYIPLSLLEIIRKFIFHKLQSFSNDPPPSLKCIIRVL